MSPPLCSFNQLQLACPVLEARRRSGCVCVDARLAGTVRVTKQQIDSPMVDRNEGEQLDGGVLVLLDGRRQPRGRFERLWFGGVAGKVSVSRLTPRDWQAGYRNHRSRRSPRKYWSWCTGSMELLVEQTRPHLTEVSQLLLKRDLQMTLCALAPAMQYTMTTCLDVD